MPLRGQSLPDECSEVVGAAKCIALLWLSFRNERRERDDITGWCSWFGAAAHNIETALKLRLRDVWNVGFHREVRTIDRGYPATGGIALAGVAVTVHLTSSSTLWRSHFLAARVLQGAIECTGPVSSLISKWRHACLAQATSCRRARTHATAPSGTDLPDGRASRFRVQSLLKKYSGFPKTQITCISAGIPSRSEGRWPSS
jgi:hypothetical protein